MMRTAWSIPKAAAPTILALTMTAMVAAQTQQPPPCPPASTSAAAAVQQVSTAVKNLGSIFKKKPAQPSSSNTNAAPCQPATSANASPPPTHPAAPGGGPAPAAASAGMNLDKPFTPPADIKVEATLLAPYAEGNTFQVSPHGVHAATLAHSGSRFQIIYDGVAGPVFDSFTPNGYLPVSFSPDGNHFGYCGVASEQFAVMVDGKQVGSGPQVDSTYNCTVYFSPNSRHFFYTMTAAGNGRDSYIRLVIDGKTELHLGDFNPRDMSWSPDGDHFAMLVDPYPGTGNGVQALIVDGKPSSLPGGAPVWSADSQHLYTMASRQGVGQTLLLDGKPLLTATLINLTIPPVGNMAVMGAYLSGTGRDGIIEEVWYLAVNGQRVPGSEIVRPKTATGGGKIGQIIISADGKHYAAICIGATGKMFVFADGKRGLDYGRVDKFVGFTPGTAKPVYEAVNGREYLVVGDQESAAPDGGSGPVISPIGDHVAAPGRGATLDGQPLNLAGNPPTSPVSSFTFTPDGAHYAFLTQMRGGGFTAFEDGVPQAAYSWLGGASQAANLWSAGHMVYFCGLANPAGPDKYGLCVDGKYAYFGPNPIYENLTLSPDGNHVFYDANKYAHGFRLFVDGQPVLDSFHPNPTWQPGTWELETDGSLEILTQDNTGLKRYTITPGTGTSLGGLVGNPTTKP